MLTLNRGQFPQTRPTPPTPPTPSAVDSHAALTKLLALQEELDALKASSSTEISRLSAALSESRVQCDSLKADLMLAERAADGRWRAAARVVWRWRMRAELRKAHLLTATRLREREGGTERR